MRTEYHLYHHFDQVMERSIKEIQQKLDIINRKVDEINLVTGGNVKVRELIDNLKTESESLKKAVNSVDKEIG